LAVSLHAPTDELRTQLVPLNRKYPIAELLAACVRYAQRKPRTSITFEYTMMKGINDRPEHARALIKLMRGIDAKMQRDNTAKVNLIPFNPFPGTQYERSEEADIRSFQTLLLENHVLTMVRRTRGDDIDAACGQLKGQVLDRTRRQEAFRRKLEQQVLDPRDLDKKGVIDAAA
ncbi:MAG TPA: 23S rRNA (adenine(2503)-C(2))-methyltransferase RlmN, partial [Xanthomonadaceae bacterium]|nr:23S rRNA (adenine(2503)-C(2))-methyltransferase RlmN [Xanthomonadaceae bacterium]